MAAVTTGINSGMGGLATLIDDQPTMLITRNTDALQPLEDVVDRGGEYDEVVTPALEPSAFDSLVRESDFVDDAVLHGEAERSLVRVDTPEQRTLVELPCRSGDRASDETDAHEGRKTRARQPLDAGARIRRARLGPG